MMPRTDSAMLIHGLSKDSALITQLRRICRTSGLDVRIGESAIDLRGKLRAQAPPQMTDMLAHSMQSPRPMFRLQPVAVSSSDPATALVSPRQQRHAIAPQPPAYPRPINHVTTPYELGQHSVRQHAAGSSALDLTASACESPQQLEMPRYISYLGDSACECPSATDFLSQASAPAAQHRHPSAAQHGFGSTASGGGAGGARDEESSTRTAQRHAPSDEPPAVLALMVASAERLELEMAHAVVSATTDAAKAVEAARLEALRAHIGGLKAAQKQCARLQALAEREAAMRAAELDEAEETSRKLKQEARRLRWALAQCEAGALRGSAALAFMPGRDAEKSEATSRAVAEREAAAWQHQLDEATALADGLAKTLHEVREQKKADDAAAAEAAEAARKQTSVIEKLRRQLATAKKAASEANERAAVLAAAQKESEDLRQQKTRRRAASEVAAAAAGTAAIVSTGGGAHESIPPGGSIDAGGVILGADGKPLLDYNGQPTVLEVALPPSAQLGRAVRKVAFALSLARAATRVAVDAVAEANADDAAAATLLGPDGRPVTPLRKRTKKKARHGEIVPAGRMLTLTRVRAKDVPDMDLRGGDKNISDPCVPPPPH